MIFELNDGRRIFFNRGRPAGCLSPSLVGSDCGNCTLTECRYSGPDRLIDSTEQGPVDPPPQEP